MKYLKILGLVAMAAAAVMAVGAATSSATVFCKTKTNTETCSEKYKIGTVVKVSSEGSLVLETTGGTVLNTCTSMSVDKELESEGSSTTTVKGPVPASELHFNECTRTIDVLEAGEGEVHWISGTDNGTGTANGGATTISTIFGSCVYGLASESKEMKDWGVLVGGEHPSESVNNIAVRVGGAALCPAEARVTAKLLLTSPEVGYVAAG